MPDKDMQINRRRTASVQVVWGLLLIAAGVGVFFRIPRVMPDIAGIDLFSSSIPYVRFCFYLIGVLLIGGGAKKLHGHYRHLFPS